MNEINKILYIGTGLHVEPVLDFPNTKEFIFIDTLPRNEWDNDMPFTKIRKEFADTLYDKLENFPSHIGKFRLKDIITLDNLYHTKILTKVQQLYYKYFTKLPKFINPTLLVFTNSITNQTIKYYISTNIEYNMTSMLMDDITTSDALIVSGHIPTINLLGYLINPIKFIGYSDTSFQSNDNTTIIDVLKNTDNKIFTEYYYVNYKNGVYKKYDNFTSIIERQQSYYMTSFV